MIDFFYHITHYIRSGGVIMIPILLISFIMWILIFNRVIFIKKLYAKNISREKTGKLVTQNLWPEKQCQGVNSLLVREFLLNRSFNKKLDNFILDEAVLKITASMDKYLSTITVLSAIAPLLGLLGTVIGMMHTFNAITVFGTGNIKAMAGGISVALITTQTGLMVSIPGLYMSGWLNRRAQNLKIKTAATGIYLKRFL